MVVDQNGDEVGMATEPFGGLLLRHAGDDMVMFLAGPGGPATSAIDFYHTNLSCTDERYVAFTGGAGFAYFAAVHQGAVFFTRTVDPNLATQAPMVAVEHFEKNEDALLPGQCAPVDANTAPSATAFGVVTGFSDPKLANLVLPLKLK